jgi:EAL domain-containing protein (putative c-di-GMP-specific phosphodiesterase class I)
VIAEGVETEEQLALLAREGCTLYQGFLCAPPVDVERLAALVSA